MPYGAAACSRPQTPQPLLQAQPGPQKHPCLSWVRWRRRQRVGSAKGPAARKSKQHQMSQPWVLEFGSVCIFHE